VADEVYKLSEFVSSGGRIAADRLKREVEALIATALTETPDCTLSQTLVPTEIICVFTFATALTPAEKTILDGIVASHSGLYLNEFINQSALAPTLRTITTSTFTLLGQMTTKLDEVAPLSRISLTTTGQFSTTGGTAEIRLVEKTTSGDTTLMSEVLPDTGSTLTDFSKVSIAPSPGLNVYRLELKVITASSVGAAGFGLMIEEIDR
jgi:hypothetical protein